MKVMLTSSLGGYTRIGEKKVPDEIIRKNRLADNLRSIWIENARVLILCAAPTEHEKNDELCRCLEESLPLNGLSVSSIAVCDDRNREIIERLPDFDALILKGGHVPTQNKFMKELGLRERLQDFHGIVVAWSAGSMNCADLVYAGPELEGEAVDPDFERWITGLGLTTVNIFPHFQYLQEEVLDGLRMIEDITLPDSYKRELIALNDGSYILIDEKTTLYGEAYLIKDGQITQICKDDESVELSI